MTPTLKTSLAGRRLIKGFEGFRRKAAPAPGGGWVIGHGHTRSARPGVSITEDDADKLLIYDLMPVETAINAHVAPPLTQNQFDALASLVFNIGTENFLNSTVLARLNAGRALDAAMAFDQWRSTLVDGQPVVVDALVRRRAAERALFLTPPAGAAPAPSPEVVPFPDAAAEALLAPAAAYHADLSEGGGMFELVQAAPETGAAASAEESVEIAAAEQALEAAADEETLEEATSEPVLEAPAAEDTLAPAEFALPRIEAALDEDEPVEEVFTAPDHDEGLRPEPEPEADFADDVLAEPEAPVLLETAPEDEDSGESWVEQARRRAQRGHAATEARIEETPREELRREDLPLRATETEWAVEDNTEYSPEHERSGVWYALFLLIGGALAAFGAYDTWQRASGGVDEAFVYGPAVAGAGVLFMAIAGWFLIKRVLAFR